MKVNKADQLHSPIPNSMQANQDQIRNQNGNIIIVVGIIILLLIVGSGFITLANLNLLTRVLQFQMKLLIGKHIQKINYGL